MPVTNLYGLHPAAESSPFAMGRNIVHRLETVQFEPWSIVPRRVIVNPGEAGRRRCVERVVDEFLQRHASGKMLEAPAFCDRRSRWRKRLASVWTNSIRGGLLLEGTVPAHAFASLSRADVMLVSASLTSLNLDGDSVHLSWCTRVVKSAEGNPSRTHRPYTSSRARRSASWREKPASYSRMAARSSNWTHKS
jgi:hypothetical protein